MVYNYGNGLVGFTLNEVEYFYERNAQSDIIVILDSDGNETGLYYLQSRYYNPEIGRFINADSYASTGQGLIGKNMFAYTNNNPVNMADPSGNLPESIYILTYMLNNPTEANSYGNAKYYASKQSYISNYSEPNKPVRSSSKSEPVRSGSILTTVVDSATKGTKSGAADQLGDRLVKSVLKRERLIDTDLGTLGCSQYVSNLGKFSKIIKCGKKGIPIVGSIVSTGVDMGESIAKEEYVGACIDVGVGAAGIGAGYVIGLGAAALVSAFALPAIGVGIAAFAVGVGVGVLIDLGANSLKDKWYGR